MIGKRPDESLSIDQAVPVLSFFTGAGFLDLGFSLVGFDIVWRNENNPDFIVGFEHAMASMNIDGKINNRSSVIDVGPNEIAREAFCNTPRPGIFGLIGGPPCPDFSVGGKNKGHEGDRGKLSQVYVNRILELGPTFFLFENVPGLLRTKKHKMFLQNLIGQLMTSFVIDIKIVNSLDYGIPQDRERVILVGFNKRWLKKNAPKSWIDKAELGALYMNDTLGLWGDTHWFPWKLNKKYENAKKSFNWPTEDPFGDEPEKPLGIPDELMVGPLICNFEETSKLPNGTEYFRPYSRRFKEISEGDVSRKSFKRLHRWRYSPAAAYGNNEVHLHPALPRRLTVREALRIQTVPDSYVLPPKMPLSHKFKTIGNGVPVKLAKAMAEGIFAVLEGGLWRHLT